MPTQPPHEAAPAMIGPYRITAVLGEGGMGVVYAAEQSEPVRRRVALKLIRDAGDASGEIAQRFAAERQALAVMEHPAIAKVYDAGTASDGSPYFVMEYIEGLPITEYCDTHQVSTADRLRLFIEVCDAIQHAHQKGVIHRDLKPTNILVTEQAGAPRPKVIDFGIAKAIDLRLGEQSLLTQHGQIIGTPAYMAPEQADSDGVDIDTRADVYALGVILYELLVGRLPLDPQELGFLPFIARLVMRETNPPTPSARLDTLAGAAVEVATRRRTNLGQLRRELAGDLDWVAMRALAPERERRYATALAFGEDLQRHLRHEPVAARPPSARYKFERFVRRNRGSVVAAVLALLALVGGSITTAIGLVRANRAERRATTALASAEREARTSTAVSDFLVDLFHSAEPTLQSGGNLTARDLLDRGVTQVEQQLDGQPVVKARVLATLGDAYGGLGFFDATERLDRRAVALADSVLNPDDPTLAGYLARLADAISRNALGGYRSAGTEVRTLRERALRIREANFASDTMAWLNALSGVAWARQASGATDSALAQLDSARNALTRQVAPGNQYVLSLRDLRSRLLINAARHDEAIATLESLLADTVVASPFWTPTVKDALANNLALSYSAAGQAKRAVAIYETLLAHLGEGRDSSTAPTYEQGMWNLAMAYQDAGEHEKAIATWGQLVDRFDAIFPDDPTQANGYRVARGHVEGLAKQWDRTRATLDTAVPIALAAMRDSRIGPRAHGQRFEALMVLAMLLEATATTPSAVEDSLQRRLGADALDLREGYSALARLTLMEDRPTTMARYVAREIALSPDVVDRISRLGFWAREAGASGDTVLGARFSKLAEATLVGALQEPGDARRWNALCWQGALNGFAERAMPACNRAVANGAPEDVARFHDSRGLARALTGDLAGAATDYEAYLNDPAIVGLGEAATVKQRRWVEELRAGRNPFTTVALEELRR